ncbi:hypothetical protein ACQKEX_14685 [Bacillus pumilus]|uniref:hypothetical protein n=1 Tax=Bacillus TaxID=1386 RepID=UPI001C221D75|nr:hypothetical protein [Bacillus pumilus]MBU8576423.1 hypothetical protein [Bacillus pumilus]
MLLKIFILLFTLLVLGFLTLAARIIIDYFRANEVAEATTREEKREIKLDLTADLLSILVDVFISSYGLYKLITTNSIKDAVAMLVIIVLIRQGTFIFVKRVFKKIFKR